MSRYQSLGHAKYRIRYHLIFSTKYRRRALFGLETPLIESFERISREADFDVIAIGADGDHVHLVVAAPPRISVTMIVRRLKQMSTHDLWKSSGDHLEKFYWGSRRGRLWTNGFFCETVGPVSEDTILTYVRNQGE